MLNQRGKTQLFSSALDSMLWKQCASRNQHHLVELWMIKILVFLKKSAQSLAMVLRKRFFSF